MPKDDIKKIAEEIAKMQVDALDEDHYWAEDCLSDRAYNSMVKNYTEDIIPIVEFIAINNFITNKTKVKDYYDRLVKQLNYTCSDPRDAYEKEDAKSQILALINIFGIETFKEE